jgi:PhnB protein
MAQISTYLNFSRNTEEAFNFYKSVFGGDFLNGKINRFKDIPAQEGMPPIAEEDKNLVMHVALPILGGHLLMGSDAPESLGLNVIKGNNVHVLLNTDSRSEADALYYKLSTGGKADMPMQDMFWGDYYGTLTDKFGIRWMVSYHQAN